jgi:hypothetical protein
MLLLYCDGHHAVGPQADRCFGDSPAKRQEVEYFWSRHGTPFEDKADVFDRASDASLETS